MTRYTTWSPARWPSLTACEACKANEDKQVLPGHRGCLPPIEGRFTADRTPVQVTVGLRVWDYNLRQGTVVEVAHHYDGTPDSVRGVVAWHLVREDDSGLTDIFDGSRMWTIHPVTGERPMDCCPSHGEHMFHQCPELFSEPCREGRCGDCLPNINGCTHPCHRS